MSIRHYLRERFAFDDFSRVALDKPVGADVNWLFTLGSLSLFLFLVQTATGIILAAYYVPSPEHAYQSVEYIVQKVPFGSVVHGIHHWSASFMVVVVFLHMCRVFFYGSYKPPREITWITGVFLFLITLAFGFTGYLLPWDLKAYWATVVGTSVPKDIPVIGNFLVALLRGGDEVSGLTLTRFYSIHMLLLPALMMVLIGVHIYLLRIHDMAGHWNDQDPRKKTEHPFFPDHVLKDSIVAAAVFVIILILSIVAEPTRQQIAGTIDPDYLPRPEWYFMWLFKILTYFSGKAEIIGSLAIPIGGLVLLLILPYLGKITLRSPADRPITTAVGIMLIMGLIYTSAMGIADSEPYGQLAVVPDRTLTGKEMIGVRVWVERDCAYCHNVKGRGGRREGPDLSNVLAKDRKRDWIIKYIKDPKSVNKWSIMPKYDLSDPELNVLGDYVLALDFTRYGLKTISRDRILNDFPKLP